MSIEIDGNSLDVKTEKLNQLKELFPEFFSEGKLNIASIKQILGDEEIAGQDHYELGWAGKAEARREVQRQTTATLLPDREGSINFDTSENIFIEGENLEVLRTLQKSYFGKVKMIYIDPPYNTGSDRFIYPDDYAERLEEYEKRTGQKNGGGYLNKLDLFKKNSKENGRYHSFWLSMIYPRLYLARNLLKEDGVIFVSIDDNEAHNLRHLMSEVFGEENFRNSFAIRRYDKNLNRQFIEQGLKSFNVGFEYILCYSKSDKFSFNPIYRSSSENRQNFGYWKGFWNDADRPTMRYDILGYTPNDGQWKWSKEKALEAVENYEAYLSKHSKTKTLEEYWLETGKKLSFIRRNPNGQGKNKGVENWISPSDGTLRNTNWTDLFASKDDKEFSGLFDFAKNVEVIKNLIVGSGSGTGDIVLDFFAGSGTTAQAVLEMNKEDGENRNFICIQMPEECDLESEVYKSGYKTIADVCSNRLRKVINKISDTNKDKMDFMQSKQSLGFKYYKLAYSNFKKWKSEIGSKEELLKQFEIFKEPLATRPTDSYDLFTELLLKSGVELNAKVERRETDDNVPFYIIKGGQMIYALDSLNNALLKEVEAVKPKVFVTLGNLFTGEKADEQITNWKLQLKESGIEFKII
jgi:adenine-specific DNA-methyltransferase